MEIINENNFKEKIKSGIVLVDFFANWCGPCRMMTPILEDIQQEFGDKISVYKVDVDEDESLAHEFNVMSIPTIVIFVNGEQKEKKIGLMQYDELVDVLNKYL